MTYRIRIAGSDREATYSPGSSDVSLRKGGTLREWIGGPDGVPLYVEPSDNDREFRVYVRGEVLDITVEDRRDQRHALLLRQTAAGRSRVVQLRAPMPGLLKEILVVEGDQVNRGDPLCILEAMKMENELRSPGDFIVGAISVDAGSPVEKGVGIMRLEPLQDASGES